jgi:hypothetical protein
MRRSAEAERHACEPRHLDRPSPQAIGSALATLPSGFDALADSGFRHAMS